MEHGVGISVQVVVTLVHLLGSAVYVFILVVDILEQTLDLLESMVVVNRTNIVWVVTGQSLVVELVLGQHHHIKALITVLMVMFMDVVKDIHCSQEAVVCHHSPMAVAVGVDMVQVD